MKQLIETDPVHDLFNAALAGKPSRVSAFMFAYTLDKHGEIDRVLIEVSKHGLHLPGGKAEPAEFELATKHHPVRWFYDATLHRELKEENAYALAVYRELIDPVCELIERYHRFEDGILRNVNERVTFGVFNGPVSVPVRSIGETDLEWMTVSTILSSGRISAVLQAAILRVGRLLDGDLFTGGEDA